MTEDIKEFDKLIKEKNISDVDKMLEESKKLAEKIPNFKEKYDKIVSARGHIIEASIKVEIAFDELITKTGGEDLVIIPEKKELHLITGAKKENELGGLSFKDKARIVKEIMQKIDDEPIQPSEHSILNDLERFVALRDIFAHASLSWFAQELEFDDNPHYKHLFKIDQKWKNVSIAVTEFMNLQREILELIPVYIKLVILKRELFSNVLLGPNFNDILEKCKKDQNEKKID
jgi:hypothetical protein